MTQKVESENNECTINITEHIEEGFFIRNPFYRKNYHLYCSTDSVKDGAGNIYETLEKSTVLGFIHYVLNGKKKLEETKEFIESGNDVAGYTLLSIRNPFYTKRIKRISVLSNDVVRIVSRGFHYLDESVGGRCVQEHTTVYRKEDDGRYTELYGGYTHRKEENGSRYYRITYKHILEYLDKEKHDLIHLGSAVFRKHVSRREAIRFLDKEY